MKFSGKGTCTWVTYNVIIVLLLIIVILFIEDRKGNLAKFTREKESVGEFYV